MSLTIVSYKALGPIKWFEQVLFTEGKIPQYKLRQLKRNITSELIVENIKLGAPSFL